MSYASGFDSNTLRGVCFSYSKLPKISENYFITYFSLFLVKAMLIADGNQPWSSKNIATSLPQKISEIEVRPSRRIF